MKEATKISLFASVLLAVFLPMVLISSVHIHKEAAAFGSESECIECTKHIPHPAHYSSHITKPEHCLYCQFLNSQYLVAAVAEITNYQKTSPFIFATLSTAMTAVPCGKPSCRAPPAV